MSYTEFKVTELRKLASKEGIKRVNRDGGEVPISSARKGELVSALEALQSELPKLPRPKDQMGSLVRKTSGDLVTMAKEELGDPDFLYVTGAGKVAALTGKVTRAIDNWEGVDGHIVASTKLDKVRDLRNLIPTEIKGMNLPRDLESKAVEYAETFGRSLAAVFKDEYTAKKTSYTLDIKAKTGDVALVKVAGLLEWAIAVVNNPQGYPWKELSVALALVTGRRLSELHSTAVFTLIPGSSDRVTFSGQLKTKGREVGAYDIPVLTEASKVVAAHEVLRNASRLYGGKEIKVAWFPDPKAAHNSLSRPLSQVVKKHTGKLEVVQPSSQPKGIKDSEDFTFHGMRELYVHIAVKVYRQPGTDVGALASRILGHAETDITTWQSYQSRVELVDSVDDLVNLLTSEPVAA